MKENGKIVLK